MLAAEPPPDRHSFLLITARDLIVVDHDTLAALQDTQTAIAQPNMLFGLLAQLLAKLGIVVPRGTVMQGFAIGCDDIARAPLSNPHNRPEDEPQLPAAWLASELFSRQ